MALGKRLINTGAAAAACLTETTDIFGDSSGVALYPLDYDASDVGGSYNGTPTDITWGGEGKINYAAGFNGSSSKITLPASTSIAQQNNYTFSAWFKTDTTGVMQTIYAFNSTSTFQSAIFIHSNGTNNIRIFSAGSNYYSSNNVYTNNQWYHIAVTKSSANGIVAYLDGNVIINEPTATANNIQSSAGDNRIGGYKTSAESLWFDGSIDQVRIFNRALSASEVGKLYREKACVYKSTTDIVNYPTGTTPIAYYKLDGSSENFAGSNDGVDTNVSYAFGRFGQAAVFDGSSSYIQASNAISNLESNFSISVWVNSDVNHFGGIINLGGKIILRTSNADLTVWQWNANKLIYDSTAPSANSAYYTYSNINPANTWTHITYVKTGTGNSDHKIYKNGVFQAQPSATNIASAGWTNLGTTIGLFGQSGSTKYNYFDGKIDQVRIYDAALTSDQVTELYNEKPEVDTSNFKTVLYEANASTNFISNVGMDLETNGGLVWLKSRDNAYNHGLFDSVRGTNNLLQSNTTAAENSSVTNTLNSFEKTGFFLGQNENSNYLNNTSSVGWVWRGGGDAVNIGVNSITASTPSIASDVSANTEAGFSIVKYTGNSTDNATVGHGLSVAPNLVIVKDLDSSNYWCVGGSTVGDGENLYLNVTTERQTRDRVKSVQTDTFTLGSHFEVNSTNDFIAYCFHSVSGYSKIGSYTGNTTTPPTVSLGFEPKWILIKKTTSAASFNHWYILDAVRDNDGQLNKALMPSLSNAEATYTNDYVSISSSGFTPNGGFNTNGIEHIYMAFK